MGRTTDAPTRIVDADHPHRAAALKQAGVTAWRLIRRSAQAVAHVVWTALRWLGRAVRTVASNTYRVFSPTLIPMWRINRGIKDLTLADLSPPTGPADSSASAILYQSEAARIAGLTTKAAGVLAAQAVIGAAFAASGSSSRTESALFLVSIVYLVFGLVAAVTTLLPRPNYSITVAEAQGADPCRAMLRAVELNRPPAVRLSNLVTSAVCDTGRSLLVLLVALGVGLFI